MPADEKREKRVIVYKRDGSTHIVGLVDVATQPPPTLLDDSQGFQASLIKMTTRMIVYREITTPADAVAFNPAQR